MTDLRRAQIRGILIEGLNFAGKTTTTQCLAERFAGLGVRVESRHCYITETAVTAELQRLAKASVGLSAGRKFPDPDLLRPFNVLKSSQMVIDSAYAIASPFASGEHSVLVQDRHWFTQYCSNEFFTPGEGYLGDEWRVHSAPRFAVQAYLTCSAAERVRRGGSRETDAHGLNAYFRAHLDRMAEFDEFCLDVIADDPLWIVLRTDEMSCQEVVDRLAAEFDAGVSTSPAEGTQV